jgi:hypothetical protein
MIDVSRVDRYSPVRVIMTLFGTTRTTLIGFIALSTAAILLSARPATAGDPDVAYKTIKTEHFDIHFEESLEYNAQLTASIAEELFADLTMLFQWKVKKKILVLITDTTDSANGSAASRGRPVIRMFANAPDLEGALSNYDHWIRALFLHELTHIIHLNIHGKTSDVINSVFGDIYLPNQMLPTFIIEGIAVLLETHKSSAGRIRSTRYNMFIRTAALEGTLLSLGQVSNTTRNYLRGSHAYIYGAMFMEYLYQRFGIEKIIEFCHQYGNSVLPYGINRAFLDIYGYDILTLYREWIEETIQQAKAAKEALSKEGLTESTQLTFHGENKGRPIFDLDDQSVLIPVSNGMQETGVFRIPLNGKSKPEHLFLSAGHSDISMGRNGRIYYNRGAPYRQYYRFNDLFSVDRQGLSPKRITVGMRTRSVGISNRGDRIAVVVNDRGTSHLQLLDPNGHIVKPLVTSAPGDQVYAPAWSPDDRTVAAVIREDDLVRLTLIDVETGERRYITDDRFRDGSPTFDPTGRYLFFESPRSGIFNIYAYDLETDTTLRVTNVLTGAFLPAVSHDGKQLAFIKYRSEGYDLHVMPLDLKKAVVVPPPERQPSKMPKIPPPADLPVTHYNPLPVMIPTHWLLNTSFDVDWNVTLQAVTAFVDITQQHHAGVDVTYDTENKVASGKIGYAYSGLGPSFHIGVTRSYTPRDEGYIFEGASQDWTQVTTRGSLSLGFPIRGVDNSHSLSLTYSVVHSRPREDIKLTIDPTAERPDVPESYFRAGFGLGWGYSDVVSSPLGIGPHRGRSMSTSLSLNHPVIGGTQTLATFRYRWTEYLPMLLLDYHTLVISLSGGIHLSDPPDQWSFSVGGYSEQNIVDTILNNTSAGSASLRGYPPDAFRGSRYHSLRLNYRFPIWFAELGYGTVPMFLKRIQGSVFSDNVIISYSELNRDDWKSSVGVEVIVPFSVGYHQFMSMRIGYARGLMEGGGNEVIFLISGGS